MALPPTWRVVKSILVFRQQTRPLAPTAPASSFGTVADYAHTTTSDHYPKVYPALGPTPVVTAGDIPRAENLYPRQVLDAIRRSRDPRVKYAISEGQMFSSYPTSAYPAWTWRPYSGADGHWSHGHLSVVADARADDERPWPISTGEDGDMAGWTQDQIDTIMFTLTDERAGGAIHVRDALLARKLDAYAAADEVRDKAVLVAIQGLTAGGNVDAAPIVAAVNAVRDEARTEFARLHTALAAAEARAARLAAKLAELGEDLAELDDAPPAGGG